MVPLQELWLPIVLSAVAVFVVSSLVHMVLQVHKKDYSKLPNEDQVMAGMRAQGVKPGQYIFPCAGSMKEMCTPEMTEKRKSGPVGYMIVIPNGDPKMGKALGQWFALSLVISLIIAYVTGLTVPRGADGMLVLRVTSTIALLGYGVAHATDSIWKGLSWGTTAKFVFDGLLYALATGAVFAWRWPELGVQG